MRGKKGFTLIELVLVIAILGVLAVTALPNIFNISLNTARVNSRDAVASAVQAALSLYGASQLSQGLAETYPAALDAAGNVAASPAVPLFGTVLKGGVARDWTKVSGTCYQYTGGQAGDNLEYIYTSAGGTFIAGTCP